MTEREKQLIEAYIPSPRDASLDWEHLRELQQKEYEQ